MRVVPCCAVVERGAPGRAGIPPLSQPGGTGPYRTHLPTGEPVKTIIRWATANPVRAVAVVAALTAGLAPVAPAWIIATVNGVIAALLGVGVHNAVTPVTTAAVRVVDAARVAATRTAEALTDVTAGAAGEVTAEAKGTINGIVTGVVGPVMRG